ncbi:MAG: FecR family protein [Gemmatimonadaceae bacterium]
MTDFLDLQHLDDDARWALLARHVAGEATAAEDAAVQRWVAGDSARAEELAMLRATTGEVPAAEGVDVEGALAKVRSRMASARPRLQVHSTTKSTRTRAPQRRWLPLAAAATLVLAAGLGWFLRDGGVAPAPSRVVATQTGQRDSVDLPDGSRVILGPASRMEIAAGFGQGTREVRLDGEAIFSVVHDDARPFTVVAGEARIVDVGTEFRVRNAAGDVEVAVLEGIVDVSIGTPANATGTTAPAATARLNAGDRALIVAGAGPAVQRGVVTADDAALRRGALVFREAPVARVLADIERWYGVRLVASSEEIAQRRFTATFTTERVDEVINMLSLALGVAADAQGDSVILRPRTLQRRP